MLKLYADKLTVNETSEYPGALQTCQHRADKNRKNLC